MYLPDPRKVSDIDTAASTSKANDKVDAEMKTFSGKPKRPAEYGTNKYSPEIRLKIAKLCIEHGPA